MGPVEGYQYNLDEIAAMRGFAIHFEAEFRGEMVQVHLGQHSVQVMVKNDKLCNMLWTCIHRKGDDVTFKPSKLYESMGVIEVCHTY